jgi:hypothetical protein
MPTYPLKISHIGARNFRIFAYLYALRATVFSARQVRIKTHVWLNAIQFL